MSKTLRGKCNESHLHKLPTISEDASSCRPTYYWQALPGRSAIARDNCNTEGWQNVLESIGALMGKLISLILPMVVCEVNAFTAQLYKNNIFDSRQLLSNVKHLLQHTITLSFPMVEELLKGRYNTGLHLITKLFIWLPNEILLDFAVHKLTNLRGKHAENPYFQI